MSSRVFHWWSWLRVRFHWCILKTGRRLDNDRSCGPFESGTCLKALQRNGWSFEQNVLSLNRWSLIELNVCCMEHCSDYKEKWWTLQFILFMANLSQIDLITIIYLFGKKQRQTWGKYENSTRRVDDCEQHAKTNESGSTTLLSCSYLISCTWIHEIEYSGVHVGRTQCARLQYKATTSKPPPVWR